MNNQPATFSRRPTLITVLCTVSFFIIAWSLWSGINKIATSPGASEQQVRKALDQLSEAEGLERFDNSDKMGANKMALNMRPLGFLIIITSLISLAGVVMMWKLKKMGFYIFTGSEISFLIGSLLILGVHSASLFYIAGTGLLSLLLITLFALNLKVMR